MRRKSERNKAKASPEKRTEKPTRKSTRRRGKRSPSTSPERELAIEADSKIVGPRGKERQEKPITTEIPKSETTPSLEEKVTSSEPGVSPVVGEKQDDEEKSHGSVWKVARADASPGEIQKLKLCRQRNTSETSSDASQSRKRSSSGGSKWQESGEGVAGGEADSETCEKLLVVVTTSDSNEEPSNDPSSSSQPGQDPSQEVSDSKEILPCETTTSSANLLSDNVDKLPAEDDDDDHDFNGVPSPKDFDKEIKPSSTTAPVIQNSIPTNGQTTKDESTIPLLEKPKQINESSEDEDRTKQDPTKTTATTTTVSVPIPATETSSSESNEEEKTKQIQSKITPRSNRRKHRNKYGDSSNSDSQDSDDENSVDGKIKEPRKDDDKVGEKKNEDEEILKDNNTTNNNVEEDRNKIVEEEEEDNKLIIEKIDIDSTSVQIPTPPQTIVQKPQKINLKRSFSTRITTGEPKEDLERTESNDQNKENHVNDQESQQQQQYVPRKRRWGISLSTDTAPISISTDSLKALVPGAKPLSINEVKLTKDDDEDRKQRTKRHLSSEDDDEEDKSNDDSTRNGAIKKATRRKISIVKDHLIKSPSPPASKPSNILLIKNLVRPFTLNQIKELLSRTGTIVENGFWMDRIKSKCFVEYLNEDQAFETRQALHGISWPMSNPKKLHVEYSNKEEMESARELSKDQPPLRKPTEPLLDNWQQDWTREERSNTVKVTVREWDLGKEEGHQHIKDKERDKKEEKKKRPRSRTPTMEQHLPAPARKFKKKEDDPPPAKLLDDLFRKTKSTPCIYWLPLTNEQIAVQEEMRRQRMAEYARRLEEMRRPPERMRDNNRRRRSPRK